MPRLSPEDLARAQALTDDYLGEIGVAGAQMPDWESVASVYGWTSTNKVSRDASELAINRGTLHGPQEQYYLAMRDLGQKDPSDDEPGADVRARAVALARTRLSRVLNAGMLRARSQYGIKDPDMAWLRSHAGRDPGRFVLQTVFGLKPESEEASDE